ncbi:MAG: type III-B CRISPR module RAMP protein Cmr6 [Phormidium sp. BM_Day4_Bin.17]|nr:type III-B CRISPR module RAMP protein Cmr6 [Phormidium sp. BM_Day4_Bin.17]UCJ11053.1 MAG: type III-B CRISPR module RAMP protein Cmr6 [Phormidium sp. PBR-2020]
MTPDPFARPPEPQRPRRPQQPQQPQRPQQPRQPQRARSGNQPSPNRSQQMPSQQTTPPVPWLYDEQQITPDPSASFIEYLRWMRSPDHDQKDPTKVQLLQLAEDNADYRQRLEQLNKRTKLLAERGQQGKTFQVKSSWRIRVGGHRGPESILLPAFDSLGMPYLPSSTLRGVARNQAVRDLMQQQQLNWKQANKAVAPWFGDLDAPNKADQAGKVVFLDAYPLPKHMGLSVDMANNIWSWDGGNLKYSPNPNPFLSLKEPTFLIGLRLASTCQDLKVLEKVKAWLIKGLQSGIGAQVNSGYGELLTAGTSHKDDEFLRLPFALQGQLIHGRQTFTRWNWNNNKNQWQTRGNPDAEVRPIALKSMLRYWFRVFAGGVLSATAIQTLEGQLFGAINPQQQWGWVRFHIRDGRVVQREPKPNRQGQRDACGEQEGTLILSASLNLEETVRQPVERLMKNLTWMMFHLGGVGQGARRPCYSRKTRERAPWYRGATLIPESKEAFWELPDTPQDFQRRFQQRLQDFYDALRQLTTDSVNPRQLRRNPAPQRSYWSEFADANCRIIACSGESDYDKPYALAVLHDRDLKVKDYRNQWDYDGDLCGKVRRGVTPSPVWIADLANYQVATIFGATCKPRSTYIEQLRQKTQGAQFVQVFPFQ